MTRSVEAAVFCSRKYSPLYRYLSTYFRAQHFQVMNRGGDSIKDPEELGSKSDHLTRTSSNTRDGGIHSMTVTKLTSLSKTVREVVLMSEQKPPPFAFKAGQWVDVFIPGVETVGGFSMCSSPQDLAECGEMRLAVKYSTHPPALWMHQSCKLGVKVNVRVGGDFYLHTDDTERRYILLVAGGVGINPLCSMIHQLQGRNSGVRICLLYSAKSGDELIFKQQFDNYMTKNESFLTNYFITGEKPNKTRATANMNYRRILQSDFSSAISFLTSLEDVSSIDAYVCGPPLMITTTTDILGTMNVKNVYFENWW